MGGGDHQDKAGDVGHGGADEEIFSGFQAGDEAGVGAGGLDGDLIAHQELGGILAEAATAAALEVLAGGADQIEAALGAEDEAGETRRVL